MLPVDAQPIQLTQPHQQSTTNIREQHPHHSNTIYCSTTTTHNAHITSVATRSQPNNAFRNRDNFSFEAAFVITSEMLSSDRT